MGSTPASSNLTDLVTPNLDQAYLPLTHSVERLRQATQELIHTTTTLHQQNDQIVALGEMMHDALPASLAPISSSISSKKEGSTPNSSQSAPCQKEACAIQDCLQAHGYDQEKCQKAVQALKTCCEQIEAQGLTSHACPKKRSGLKP
ncbi:MAG: hypothetical protein DHS80DRAFT_32378 [Piptocephalis tieghemiana]|nr:MAG: hypothetical protein DHS80DRAFT_32378 [Piptocephalis tieghemiana]